MGPKHEKYLIFLSCSPVPLLYATPCCIHATMKLHQVVAMLVCVRDTANEVIKVTKMVRPKHVAPECAVVPTTMSPAAMHCVLKDGVDHAWVKSLYITLARTSDLTNGSLRTPSVQPPHRGILHPLAVIPLRRVA
ncbi:hypothetical protein BJV77DRAFT_308597 [Russula vinacea]|nr:hypothetical protein BJV77DRAFT_308597 [Russula vinacea]